EGRRVALREMGDDRVQRGPRGDGGLALAEPRADRAPPLHARRLRPHRGRGAGPIRTLHHAILRLPPCPREARMTADPLAQVQNFTEVFERWAQKTPEAVAFRYLEGGAGEG